MSKAKVPAWSDTGGDEDVELLSAESLEEAGETEVWDAYKCRSLDTLLKDHPDLTHPGDVCEAASLAGTKLPETTYPILDSLSKPILKRKLSSLQLEGVVYAAQSHLRFLPDGTRAGFYIGDSAGVGKGRQIAAILLDNFARGRMKHCWFSVSSDLLLDAQRDLKDIGCTMAVHAGLQSLDKTKKTKGLGLSRSEKEGVLFSTYSSLVSSGQKGSKQNRFDQILEWCGGASFEGCIILDECHKAKNFSEGKADGSKVAARVVELQKKMPKARIVYASATGVTNIDNMAYMSRLGLWGPKLAFANFDDFKSSMGKRNLGALEMLAMELKSAGLHVSRCLSFRRAEFEIVKTGLTKQEAEDYNLAARFWADLKFTLMKFISCGVTDARSAIWKNYWAAHQRFFRNFIVAVKARTLIAQAKKEIEQGNCVVIGLQTTGEAMLNERMRSKSSDQESIYISTCRMLLSSFINTHFPVKCLSKKLDPREVPVVEDELKQAKLSLLDRCESLRLPPSTIDHLIASLGGTYAVAEMTGRNGRVVNGKYVLRESSLEERNMFMDGDKDIAIISDAASTGISLHAAFTARNQKRRVHFTLELPWAADAAIQQLGRSHRTNQANAPFYKLLTTGLGGENRFISAVAQRLNSLGALTHGDRRASSGGIALEEFNFNTNYGKQALTNMYEAIQAKRLVPGVDWKEVLGDCKDFFANDTGSETRFWQSPGPIHSAEAFIEATYLCSVLISDEISPPDEIEAQYVRSCRASSSADQGIKLTVATKDTKDVKRFLNRILGLPAHFQALMFAYFARTLEIHIKQCKLDGLYDEGVSDVRARSITRVGKVEFLYTHPGTNGHTMLHTLNIDRGLSFEEASERAKSAIKGANPDATLDSVDLSKLDELFKEHDLGGFFVSKRIFVNEKTFSYVLALRKASDRRKYTILRPNTGQSGATKTQAELYRIYTPIGAKEVQKPWEDKFKKSITDGQNLRVYTVGVLVGCVVPLWGKVSTLLKQPDLALPKSQQALKIIRASLDNGERVVGLRIAGKALSALRAMTAEMTSNAGYSRIHLSLKMPEGVKIPGMSLSSKNVVIKVTAGSPAEQAGLRRSDKVIAISGRPLDRGTDVRKVFTLAFRANREKIELTVSREDDANPRVEVATPVVASTLVQASRKHKKLTSFFKVSSSNSEDARPRSSGSVSTKTLQFQTKPVVETRGRKRKVDAFTAKPKVKKPKKHDFFKPRASKKTSTEEAKENKQKPSYEIIELLD